MKTMERIVFRGLPGILLFACLAVPVPVPALAQAEGAKILVEGAWARRAVAMKGDSKSGSGNGVVYATLSNPGKESDVLLGAESEAAETVEIHETYRDMGMMMMRRVRKIDVPAGRGTELKPGGYHVMLLNLKRDLKAGESLVLTLQFEKAGKIPITATVK